jgi:hypothetical protein
LNRLAAFSDSRDGAFERLVFALVMQGKLDPEALTDNALVGMPPDHPHRVAIVRDGPDAARDVSALLKAPQAVGGIELVLVGGGPDRVAGVASAGSVVHRRGDVGRPPFGFRDAVPAKDRQRWPRLAPPVRREPTSGPARLGGVLDHAHRAHPQDRR